VFEEFVKGPDIFCL